MPKLKQLTIEGYRSIDEEIVINFPNNIPLVLLGENNAGKSNIIRAIDLIFGEFHPKYKKLDDFDHFNRDPKVPIKITAKISGLVGTLSFKGNQMGCSGLKFRSVKGSDNDFVGIQSTDGKENQFVKTELREELLSIIVNSEYNLNYQLSYSSKFTLLSRVTKAFHEKLSDDPKKISKLKSLFSEIKDTFLEVEEFKVFNKNMSSIADSILSNMTHALAFDFSAYDPSNYFKTLKIHPTENGEIRAFEELGTGQQQILALSFAHAYAKSFMGQGLIFILDEPEAHLHPLAQKWLAKKMFQMAQDGLQLIITTHSPYFIDLNFLEGINLIRKEDNCTYNINHTAQSLYNHCLQTGSNSKKTSLDSTIPFYANNSTPHILSGFFAKKIILVEGMTEEFALPIFFERLGLDSTEFGIEIISVGGKGNLAKWWRLYTLYTIPTFICFDNDSKKDDEKGEKRKDALKAIGIKDEELESILSTDDWTITNNYCIFGKNYETTMRNSFPDYENIENQIKETLGSSSKNLIARETAKQINLSSETEGKKQIEIIIEKIRHL
ncbi:ATP-dependent endonuclease [Leptospira sp. WS39.C2]